jgi:hypothetical protein
MVTILEEVSLTMVDFLYVVSTSLGIHEKIRQNVHVVGGFLGVSLVLRQSFPEFNIPNRQIASLQRVYQRMPLKQA